MSQDKEHRHSELRMIPLSQIEVLNPRERNSRVFEQIVGNIQNIGLKKPITVTPRPSSDSSKRYLLICGEGRLKAFKTLGEPNIPALVVQVSDEEAFIMSLTENIARRKCRPLELLAGIDLLRNAHAAGIRVPMLMMTGVADRETDVEAMQAGAADYLVKGRFDGEQLARAIRYAVDRTRYLAQLADSEARYRTLFEHMPIPLWIYAIDSYRFLAVNDAAIDHYGWSREEFMAMSVLDVRPEDERETFIGFHRGGAMRGLVNAGLWTHLRRDGSRIDVEVTSHDIIWDGVPSRMVVCLDVTAQRRAEVALRKREVQLRQILTDVDDARELKTDTTPVIRLGFWVLVVPGRIYHRQPLWNEGPPLWHLAGATLPLLRPLS